MKETPDVYAAPVFHVSVIRGGLWSGDGAVDLGGMDALARSIQINMPGVQVITWYWGQADQVYQTLANLPTLTKRVLIGFSGGGSRITMIARTKPLQRIDLAIGYDPSPIGDMKSLRETKVEKAICYYNKPPCPNFFGYGGGEFAGIENLIIKEICEFHLSVQCDPALHKQTFEAIAQLFQSPISRTKMRKMLRDASCYILHAPKPLSQRRAK